MKPERSWTRRCMANSYSTDSTRVVLLTMAEHADKAGECWPSVSRIARLSNLKDRQVQRRLKQLVEMQELEIVEKGGGRNKPTRYRITVSYSTPFHDAKGCHDLPGYSPHLRNLLQQSKKVS